MPGSSGSSGSDGLAAGLLASGALEEEDELEEDELEVFPALSPSATEFAEPGYGNCLLAGVPASLAGAALAGASPGYGNCEVAGGGVVGAGLGGGAQLLSVGDLMSQSFCCPEAAAAASSRLPSAKTRTGSTGRML